MSKAKSYRRVLISPLNWGLGHATRLVPIVEELLKQGHYVLITGEGASLTVLRNAFPQLDWQELPGFNISLSRHNFQWLQLLKQVPAFLSSIKKEHTLVKKLIEAYRIDLIISDNRYGLYSQKTASVIITHQTNPFLGKYLACLRPVTKYISSLLLKRFDECWIPDTESNTSLSGSLSKPSKTRTAKHIGHLSRLMHCRNHKQTSADILVILSGPEPQRTKLEHLIIKKLKETSFKTTILCANPKRKVEQTGNITLLPHCTANQQYELIINSKHIICRSGYSTLMDLVTCQKTALLIPTPGQHEQIYLAQRATNYFGFKTIDQKKLKYCLLSDILISTSNTHMTTKILKFKLPELPLMK